MTLTPRRLEDVTRRLSTGILSTTLAVLMLIIVTGLFLAVPATGTRFSLDALVAEDSRPADMIGSSGSLCLDEMTFV